MTTDERNRRTISPLMALCLLAAAVVCAGYNRNMLRVPLKGEMRAGGDHPAVVFEGLTLKPISFFVSTVPDYEKGDGRDSIMVGRGMFHASVGSGEREIHLSCDMSDDGRPTTPVAMHEYLIGAERSDGKNGPEVALTVEKIDFGRAFFLYADEEAIIGTLTVRVDQAGHEHASYGPGKPFVAYGICSITLSEGDNRETFHFNTHDMERDGWPPTVWGGYKLWVLNMFDGSVRLKIEKSEQ